MKLETKKFAMAAGLTVTVAYAVCATFAAIWPEAAVRFLGWMLHIINIEKVAGDVKITLGSVILGWIPLVLYSYFTALIFAWLYNRSLKN